MKHIAMPRRKQTGAPPITRPAEAKDESPVGPAQGRAAPLPAAAVKSAFDAWIDQGLHALFDGVKDEPIPEELLRLIEQDRQK